MDGGENGCRNNATKMHRENGNLIAVKWTEGKMVAAIMRQKGKMERFIRLTIDKILFYWTKKCLNVCTCQKKAVISDAACPVGIPPKVRSRPAGHMQA